MKKVISGTCCIISATLLNISFLLVTFLCIDETEPYYKSYGRFWQSAIDNHFMSLLIVSCFLLVLGLVFIVWGIFDKRS